MPEHLIDIASYNTVTDWDAVRKDGIVGASVKISQATNYLNPERAGQVVNARRAGVAAGGYHFGDPRVGATEQAKFFVNNAKPLNLFEPKALAPMYDAENWDGNFNWAGRTQLSTHIREFVKVVHGETGGVRVLVYGSLTWWQTRWLVPEDWAVDGVEILNWIAVYNGDPTNLQGWSHPLDALHQHTSSGRVPGIVGNVDKNITLRGRALADLTTRKEDDDMALSDDDVKRIANAVADIMVPVGYGVTDTGTPAQDPLPLTEHMRGSNHGIWTEPERVGDEVKALVQTSHDDLKADINRLTEVVTNLELGGGATDDQVERVMRTSGLFTDVLRRGDQVRLGEHIPDAGQTGG